MKSMQELLQEDDKGLSKAVSPTAIVFRAALIDSKMTPSLWSKRLTEYINSPRSGIVRSKDAINVARNNANTQLASPTLSWKKLRVGLRVLDPESIDVSITKLEWRDEVDVPIRIRGVLVRSRVGVDDLKEIFTHLYAKTNVSKTPSVFTTLLRDYVKNIACKHTANPADISTKRSNLLKDFNREWYSWKTFTEMLGIIGVKSFRLNVVLNWRSGKSSLYDVDVRL